MLDHCKMEGCAEAAIATVDDRTLCYKHFLDYSYKRLEVIAGQIHEPHFHNRHAESTGRFLEDCMRDAADIACVVKTPTNLERARVLDVLLWASELHGLLRRGPRVPARISILLRSEISDRCWEEKTETQLLSRNGAQILCRHEAKAGDRLTCVRLDNGARVEANVVWVRRRASGEVEMGIEFLTDVNFWNFGSVSAVPSAAPSATLEHS